MPASSELHSRQPIVLVDMAGNQQVTRAVHEHFGDKVKYSCQVGLTHWEKVGDVAGLPGAKPTFFFAPSQIEKRIEDWGADGFQARLQAAWREFLDGTKGWLRVVHGRGAAAIERAYQDTLEGRAKPEEGHVLSFRS